MLNRLSVVLALALLLTHLMVLVVLGSHAPGPLLSDLLELLLGVLATVASYKASKQPGRLGSKVWFLTTVALFVWTVGQAIITYYENVLRASYEAPWPSDPFIFLWVVPLAMTVFVDSESTSEGINWEQSLDFFQVVILAISVYLTTLFVPSFWEAAPRWMAIKTWEATDLRDVLIAAVLFLKVLPAPNRVARNLYLRVFALVLFYGLADRLYHYAEATRGTVTGSRLDLLWSIPFVVVTVAASTWRGGDDAERQEQVTRIGLKRRIDKLAAVFLPMLVLLACIGVQKERPLVAVALVLASLACAGTRLLLSELRRDKGALLQSALFQIADAANSKPDLPELCSAVHQILGSMMDVQNFYIALYEAATDSLSFPYFVDQHEAAPQPQKPGKGLTEYVLRTGQALLATPKVFDDLARRGEVQSIGAPSVNWLGVPLKKGQETFGVLVLQSYSEDVRLGEREKEILTFVSQQVARVIEYKRSEAALHASESRYRTLFERNMAGVFRSTLDGKILDCNQALAQILGYTREELLNLPAHTLYPGGKAQRDQRIAKYRQLRQSGSFEMCYRRKDSGLVWVLQNISFTEDEHGNETSEATVLDITARKLAEQEISDWKNRYDTAVLASGQIIYDWDPASTLVTFGGAFREVLGYSPSDFAGPGQNWRALLHPDDRERYLKIVQHTLESKEPVDFEYRVRRKDGTYRTVREQARVVLDASGAVRRLVGFITDVTEHRMLEQQLRQAMKMEAVGRLAGGIAHDFNNLLTVITGYSEFQSDHTEPTDPLHVQAEQIKLAAGRAASLTRQLLAFSRQQVLQPQTLNLNSIVANLDNMLRRLIGEHIEVQTVLADDLGSVTVDPGQLEQVLMNLVLNSRDAMPQGGKLTIETANVELDESYAVEHREVTPGRYVRLAVTDTGTGMDREVRARIFEPFFTTKQIGEGTGLGLSTVYGIVKQSGGHIEVYSELGQGTTFKIYLLRVDKPVPTAEHRSDSTAQNTGSETILLVEDDAQLRELAACILDSRGYRVLAAGNAEQVDAICDRETHNIDLLLTDVVMPGVSGTKIAKHVAERCPGIKILYMSGYTSNAIVHHGVLDQGIAFLQKPFTPAVLTAKVREVLDSST